ncbi:MAG: hypothetical protein F6K34_01110 [Okeania sp. SIO4D6]|nr:hypothetical protein [Okeania sp. SIO4D6]
MKNQNLSTISPLTKEKTFNPEYIYNLLNLLEQLHDLGAFVVDLDDIAIAIKMVKGNLTRYIKSDKNYFDEGIDFYFSQVRNKNGFNKPIDKYYLTIDATKELLFILNTTASKQFRRFFIEKEREHRKQNQQLVLDFNLQLEVLNNTIEDLENRCDNYSNELWNLKNNEVVKELEEIKKQTKSYRETMEKVRNPYFVVNVDYAFDLCGYARRKEFMAEVIRKDFVSGVDYYEIPRKRKNDRIVCYLTYKCFLICLIKVRGMRGINPHAFPEYIKWLIFPTKGNNENMNSRAIREDAIEELLGRIKFTK